MKAAEAFVRLGFLGTGASPDEIQEAWKSRSWMEHPDQGGSVEGFAKLSDARRTALFFALDAPCRVCKGSGIVYEGSDFVKTSLHCTECSGTGKRYGR